MSKEDKVICMLKKCESWNDIIEELHRIEADEGFIESGAWETMVISPNENGTGFEFHVHLDKDKIQGVVIQV